jgi:hypothetical protein
MITHVAEAAEARGRVVLRLTAGRVQLTAIDAAVRLATAYRAEIESLYVEDIELLRLASYSFATEIPALADGLGQWPGGQSSRLRRPLSVAAVERDMRLQFSGLQRLVDARAARADVIVRLRVVRAEPAEALAATCADGGPWNVVVLAQPLTAVTAAELDELFATVPDMTGLVLVGAGPELVAGPVVVVVEDANALAAMLPTAERLVDDTDTDIVLLVIADGPERGSVLEGQMRLALADRPPVVRADGTSRAVQLISLTETQGDLGVIADAIRRLAPGFLIARFGGLVVPLEGSLQPLATILRCPLLLNR